MPWPRPRFIFSSLVVLPLLLALNSCGGLFYFPDSYLYSNPSKYGHAWEEVHFRASDETPLHGWLIKTQLAKPKGTIIFFHGNAQNLSSHFQSLEWMVAEGFDLFVFDYRGYGKSSGEATKDGIYGDALAALEKGYEFFKMRKSQSLIIYAQSLGGIVSIPAVAGFHAKNEINFYVLESTFSSYQEIAFDKLKQTWWLFPFSPLAFVLVNDDYAAASYLKELPVTTKYLVIHGTDDVVVPYKFGEELFKLLPHPQKQFLRVEGGRHINAYFHENKRYRAEYLKFIQNNLSQKN
jgi:fermentation-respiration switch protein FrsA (DUF1100 family)